MTLALIWITASLLYAVFYCWYVGFRSRLTAEEVDAYCKQLEIWGAERVALIREVLIKDTGREFFMANVIKIRRKTAAGESGRTVFDKYQIPFLKGILKKACHPIAIGRAASPAVECWGIENAENWDFAAFIRYRSRRDLAEILVKPEFGEIHPFKEAGIEKTFAFMCDPAAIIGGGPKLLVPAILVAVASVCSLLAC